MNGLGTEYVNAASASKGAPESSPPGSATIDIIRKKVLLQILAVREAERLGITATPEEVASATDGFRNTFGLNDDDVFCTWLDCESIRAESFERFMYQFATVAKVESFYGVEIERQARDMSRIDAARSRAR